MWIIDRKLKIAVVGKKFFLFLTPVVDNNELTINTKSSIIKVQILGKMHENVWRKTIGTVKCQPVAFMIHSL